MSDINAAPSSTEPADNPNWTPEQLAEIQARNVVPMQINQIAEAGTATGGESASGAGEEDFTSASSGSADSTSADAPLDSASSTNTGSASVADAGNVVASPAGGQSASDTASSVQDALLDADIAADVSPVEPSTAHCWLSLLERKLAALEHEARDELVDVARQLREAL
ncbi:MULTISPECIES: hypothetical protein [Burkholderia]|nr:MULTISPECIES: hypothetical protein [Burkholderia]EKS9798245.1 hypothetical protein [Burkholderia cepacia]EKS9808392.1 hypothetical protein [Burkholderia cepacia]EKS9816002.1 hypothetical protein [Burkholderia cepacia]EKS9823596.1 hypothetical protein [Burkholderia cepacia]EKS9827324.1 hypothetical protein [Burkholderia cepacia]